MLLVLAGTAWSQPALSQPALSQPALPPASQSSGAAPQPLSLLDVPFISQSEALCGGAAAAMVLRYWGARGLTAESFAHLVDRSAAGIRTSALVADLQQRGWNTTGVEGTRALIARELARGRPVLTLIEDRPGTYHYVVVVAATDASVVFHDPARAPYRVMSSVEFARRWEPADRWMAVIVPADAPHAADTIAAPAAVPSGAGESTGTDLQLRTPLSCDALLAEGIRRAQASDLDGSERLLTRSLSCGGAAPLRELAGVRLLQRRWADVSELASAAVAEDPRDLHAWRLLATSRFVQDDPSGALAAWNRAGEPRVDLVGVAGLERTRQRPIERLMAVAPGELLTSGALAAARRRLAELPAAQSTRIEYVPLPGGLAELRATVVERRRLPRDLWDYAALGLTAAARREVEWSAGALTGEGDGLTGAWRFWPGRPRVAAGYHTVAPWGGVWGVEAFTERQPFTSELPASERAGGWLSAATWWTSSLRGHVRVGAEEWNAHRVLITGGGVRVVTPADRVAVHVDVSGWTGSERFAVAEAGVQFRSTTARRGRVYVARGGAAAATTATPADGWFAGDTGNARPVLLRAHPLVEDGRFNVAQLGRRVVHASAEAQRWWPVRAGVRAAAAVFLDGVRTSGRLHPGTRTDLDAGAGARLALPGIAGIFRVDVARGLRDGQTAVSFAYEP